MKNRWRFCRKFKPKVIEYKRATNPGKKSKNCTPNLNMPVKTNQEYLNGISDNM